MKNEAHVHEAVLAGSSLVRGVFLTRLGWSEGKKLKFIPLSEYLTDFIHFLFHQDTRTHI